MESRQEPAPRLVSSLRTDRLRFLARAGLVLLLLMVPGLLLSKILYAGHPQTLAHLTIAAALLLPPAAMAWVSIRRLHDLGRTGAWALVPLVMYVCLLLTVRFGANLSDVKSHLLSVMSLLYSSFLPLLYIGAVFSPLALLPGDQGSNRFGPPSPPASRNTRAGAYAAIALYAVCAAIPAGAYLHQRHQEQQSVDDALARATSAESEWRAYFRLHKAWPDPLNEVITDSAKRHLRYWRSRDGAAFVIEAPVHIDDGVLHYYPGGVDLTGVVVWSTDGGESWHCGPYGISLSALPEPCRDLGIPAYTGPI